MKKREPVVMIGRFTPIGECSPTATIADKKRVRHGVLLREDGEPICRTVKLERVMRNGVKA